MYTPKLTGKGFQKRARHALGMTLGCLSAHKPRQLGKRFIDQYFGHSGNNISRWLRDQLLVCVDESYTKGTYHSKSYVYNPDGVDYISKLLGQEFQYNSRSELPYQRQKELNHFSLAVDWANEQFDDHFDYQDKSNRLWHPLQNVNTQVREEVLRKLGILFKYDIEAAAPTILYQYSRQIPLKLDSRNRWLQGPNPLVLKTLEYYLANKSHVRKKLASEAELSVDVSKRIINALFAGAVLAANNKTAIFDLVEGDVSKIKFLQQNQFVIGLKKDIADMWGFIKPVISRNQAVDKKTKQPSFNKDGSPRLERLASRHKWNVYFQQERRVLDEIRAYLELPEVNTKYFLIHDGFYTNKPIDIQDLLYWIEAGTDYQLIIEAGKDWYGLAPQAQHIQESSIPSVQTGNAGWYTGITWKTPEPLTTDEFYKKYGEYPTRTSHE